MQKKAFYKVQHSFITKPFRKLGIEGNVIKYIYKKKYTQHIILNVFSIRSGNSQGCQLLPLVFNFVLDVLANSISFRKRNKRHLE